MYGRTSLTDKSVLSKGFEELQDGDERTVRVTIQLIKGDGILYTIRREQEYHRKTNRWEANYSKLSISMKKKDGKTTRCNNEDSVIDDILPYALASYFFFDGERIDAMGKQLGVGRRCQEFSDAVKSLTGLQATQKALEDLNPNTKKSVIGRLVEQYQGDSKSKLEKYNKAIEALQEELERIEEELETIEGEIDSAEMIKAEVELKLRELEESRNYQAQKEIYQKQKEASQKIQISFIRDACLVFNEKIYAFLLLSLIKRAFQVIAESNYSGKSIPSINENTINFLLKRGSCICGTSLSEHPEAMRCLEDLKETLPPNAIGNVVAEFTKYAKSICSVDNDVIEAITEKLSAYETEDEKIDEFSQRIGQIERLLGSQNVSKEVQECQKRIDNCADVIRKNSLRKDELLVKKGSSAKDKERQETERKNLAHKSRANNFIEECKNCANRVYQCLKLDYETSENEIREKLERYINDIFKTIFDGDLYLTIDSKYHVGVTVNNYEEGVETSQAQNISVIFAFISAIIKIAREKQNSRSSEEEDSSEATEPYPLVMDAPLSSFDKRRIKAICSTIPKIAEQVIIFIKDTDGDLAEEYLGKQIGVSLYFVKYNDFRTKIQKDNEKYV